MAGYCRCEFRLTALVLAAWLLSAGYAPPLATAAELGSSVSGHAITVGDAENGRAITLSRGDTLILLLASNRSTGYAWKVVRDDPAYLKPLGAPAYKRPPGSPVGGGGYQLFRFIAEKPGTASLTLKYSRPWEQDVPPAKTYQLTVNVE